MTFSDLFSPNIWIRLNVNLYRFKEEIELGKQFLWKVFLVRVTVLCALLKNTYSCNVIGSSYYFGES